jgi:hypothetical protein
MVKFSEEEIHKISSPNSKNKKITLLATTGPHGRKRALL